MFLDLHWNMTKMDRWSIPSNLNKFHILKTTMRVGKNWKAVDCTSRGIISMTIILRMKDKIHNRTGMKTTRSWKNNRSTTSKRMKTVKNKIISSIILTMSILTSMKMIRISKSKAINSIGIKLHQAWMRKERTNRVPISKSHMLIIKWKESQRVCRQNKTSKRSNKDKEWRVSYFK